MIRGLSKLGVPAYAHSVVRTAEEQAELVAKGVSRDSPDDGRWPHKAHAVDVVHSGKHWELTDQQWLVFGHVGKEVAKAMGLKVTWGGDWRRNPSDRVGWDPAHWEVFGWKAEADQYPFPNVVLMLGKWEKGWRKKLQALQADNPS